MDLDTLLQRALSLADDGDWVSAAELLREQLGDFGDEAALHCALGVAERELGNAGLAYECFKKALQLQPEDPYVLATAGNGVALFDDPDAMEALKSAALLAPDKLHGVVCDPSDCAVIKTRERLRVLAEAVRFRAGIKMDDLSARLRAGERHQTRIAKQVENLCRTARLLELFLCEGPVDGVFLKDAHVAEWGTACFEADTVPLHRPCVRGFGIEASPFAAFIVASLGIKPGISLPAFDGFVGAPEGLRIRADNGLTGEALQLHAVTAVEEGVVLPVICEEERLFVFHANPRWRQAS